MCVSVWGGTSACGLEMEGLGLRATGVEVDRSLDPAIVFGKRGQGTGSGGDAVQYVDLLVTERGGMIGWCDPVVLSCLSLVYGVGTVVSA